MKNSKVHYSQFLTKEGNFVATTDVTSADKILPGFYEVTLTSDGAPAFQPKTIFTERYIEMPSMATNAIVNEINTFWSQQSKTRYDQLGLMYKRGILMYGVPGTGKTATIMKVAHKVVEEGGIVVYNPSPNVFNTAINALREIQGECRVLCIFEEFDRYCEKADFLGLLDGELQISNVVYIATTNHINSIPDSLKKRPSRFATVIEIKAPEADAREAYIKQILPQLEKNVISALVKATQGLVIDQIKDVLISSWVFENTVKDAVRSVRMLGGNGFGLASDDDDDTSKAEITLLGFKLGEIKTRY